MFRTSLKVTAGAIVAVSALVACGPVRVGSAALIGDDRITTAKLDSTVRQWNKEYGRDEGARKIQEDQKGPDGQPLLPFDLESPKRSALFELISMRVWDEVARKQNVSVTRGQVDATINQPNVGRAFVVSNVLARDLPASYSEEWVRSRLIQAEMLRMAGMPAPLPQSAPAEQQQAALLRARQAQAQVVAIFVQAAKGMDINVNPRFGTFQAEAGAEEPVTIKPASPSLSSPDRSAEKQAGRPAPVAPAGG